MYDSLGLEYITDENLNTDDNDVLIPEVFVNKKRDYFKSVLIANGYNPHYIFQEISSEVAIGTYNIMEAYNLKSLENNVKATPHSI